jgi:hypothetical protein
LLGLVLGLVFSNVVLMERKKEVDKWS